MADHMGMNKPCVAAGPLLAHSCSSDAGGMAMAILLRRPLPEQLDHLVLCHPSL